MRLLFRTIVLAALNLQIVICLGQESLKPNVSERAGVPIAHLYSHFFLYEARLVELQQVPLDNGAFYKKIETGMRIGAGLSEKDWDRIKTASLQWKKSHVEIEDQIHTLIHSDRKVCPEASNSCSPNTTHVSAVRHLMAQRQASLAEQREALDLILGDEASTKFENYLKLQFSNNVRVVAPNAEGGSR